MLDVSRFHVWFLVTMVFFLGFGVAMVFVSTPNSTYETYGNLILIGILAIGGTLFYSLIVVSQRIERENQLQELIWQCVQAFSEIDIFEPDFTYELAHINTNTAIDIDKAEQILAKSFGDDFVLYAESYPQIPSYSMKITKIND